MEKKNGIKTINISTTIRYNVSIKIFWGIRIVCVTCSSNRDGNWLQ